MSIVPGFPWVSLLAHIHFIRELQTPQLLSSGTSMALILKSKPVTLTCSLTLQLIAAD